MNYNNTNGYFKKYYMSIFGCQIIRNILEVSITIIDTLQPSSRCCNNNNSIHST